MAESSRPFAASASASTPGKTLAIVGESGCGKSVTVQSIMGLTPMPPGRITRGTALLNGIDIIKQKIINGEDIRGAKIGMIFQDPMSSLNPTMKVGDQIAETLQVHRGFTHRKATARAVELLGQMHIPEADKAGAAVSVFLFRRHASARDDCDGDRL